VFPEGAQTTTVTVTAGLTDGTVEHEPITFTPTPQQVINTALKDIRESDPVTLTPDWATGAGQIRLLNTDADGYLPSGWTYEVRRGDRPPYFVEVPASLGATVDLSALTPVAANPGTYDLLVPLSELGNAATKNVGTVAGTVATGDDSRFGTIGGIAVSGTPAAGKVPTASSGTAISWQTPPGGGGGGVVPIPYADIIDAGIVVLTTNGTWDQVVGSNGVHVRRVIPNVHAGDVMQFTASFLRIGTAYYLDGRILKTDGSPSRYLSSLDDGSGVPGPEGYAPWYPQLSFKEVNGFRTFVVEAGEIAADGTWTIEMVYQGTAIVDNSNHLYWGNGYIGSFDVWHWPLGA